MKRQIGVLRGTGERSAPEGGKAAERLGLTMDATRAHTEITRYWTKGNR